MIIENEKRKNFIIFIFKPAEERVSIEYGNHGFETAHYRVSLQK